MALVVFWNAHSFCFVKNCHTLHSLRVRVIHYLLQHLYLINAIQKRKSTGDWNNRSNILSLTHKQVSNKWNGQRVHPNNNKTDQWRLSTYIIRPRVILHYHIVTVCWLALVTVTHLARMCALTRRLHWQAVSPSAAAGFGTSKGKFGYWVQRLFTTGNLMTYYINVMVGFRIAEYCLNVVNIKILQTLLLYPQSIR